MTTDLDNRKNHVLRCMNKNALTVASVIQSRTGLNRTDLEVALHELVKENKLTHVNIPALFGPGGAYKVM